MDGIGGGDDGGGPASPPSAMAERPSSPNRVGVVLTMLALLVGAICLLFLL